MGGTLRTRLFEKLRSRTQLGAAAVEFAILLPLLLLFVGGIVDFGRAMFTKVELTNAAREGARAAIIGSTAVQIRQRVEAAIPPPPVPPGFSVTITPCAGPTTDATVVAGMDFDWLVLGPVMAMVGAGPALPNELESSAVMRCTA